MASGEGSARRAEPIFVRGFSRSGGTLVVTVLDAHPAIAMSYELYPHLLEGEGEAPPDLRALARALEGGLFRARRLSGKEVRDRGLRTFLTRCARSGLGPPEAAGLLRAHLERGLDFSTLEGRLRFMEACAGRKMEAAGKAVWGLKCSNRFEEYLTLWPGARFIDVIRDGRDVLASQLHTGSFDHSPEEVGRSWANTHRRFRELKARPGARAHEVRYEELTLEPEAVVRRLCEFLEVEFHPALLSFYRQDLSIYKADHLSMERIQKPIDPSRIGRWRKDLTEDQLRGFLSTAREMMEELGYGN